LFFIGVCPTVSFYPDYPDMLVFILVHLYRHIVVLSRPSLSGMKSVFWIFISVCPTKLHWGRPNPSRQKKFIFRGT